MNFTCCIYGHVAQKHRNEAPNKEPQQLWFNFWNYLLHFFIHTGLNVFDDAE